MTKEELEKEAIQYAVDYPTSYGKGYKHKDLRIAYLAGAEPREKRIEELEKEHARLTTNEKSLLAERKIIVKENTELRKKNKELQKEIQGLYLSQ